MRPDHSESPVTVRVGSGKAAFIVVAMVAGAGVAFAASSFSAGHVAAGAAALGAVAATFAGALVFAKLRRATLEERADGLFLSGVGVISWHVIRDIYADESHLVIELSPEQLRAALPDPTVERRLASRVRRGAIRVMAQCSAADAGRIAARLRERALAVRPR